MNGESISPFRGRPVTVDAVIFRGKGAEKEILLILRGREPFKGKWALPGGFVELNETCEEAVLREVQEETGIAARIIRLSGVYSAPNRDPRHVVTVVFVCAPIEQASKPNGGDDASNAEWFKTSALPNLAADHAAIISDALKKD